MIRKDIISQGKTLYYTEFTSLEDLFKHTSIPDINKDVFNPYHVSSIEGPESFTGTKSLDHANTLLKYGWEKGAQLLTKKFKLENVKLGQKERRKMVNDIVGFQANVPRYLQGIPTNMVNQTKVVKKQKIINLVKGITYKAGVSADRIIEDSTKTLLLVNELEKKGFRVNLSVMFSAFCGNERVLFKTKIKAAGEKLNISKLAYPMVNPSFLRRHMFRSLENEKRIKNKSWAGGYGQPLTRNEDVKGVLNKEDIYIPILISELQMKNLLIDIEK